MIPQEKKIKDIILVTDFSQYARMAAMHAAGLARHFSARLIICHVLDPDAENGDILESGEGIPTQALVPEEHAQDQLDAIAQELHGLYGISITRLIKPGTAADEILALARQTDADLLVMGTRGEGIPDDRLLGTVAVDLLAKSSIPVVCMPARLPDSLPAQLDLIITEKRDCCNAQGLKLLQEIAGQLDSDKPLVLH